MILLKSESSTQMKWLVPALLAVATTAQVTETFSYFETGSTCTGTQSAYCSEASASARSCYLDQCQTACTNSASCIGVKYRNGLYGAGGPKCFLISSGSSSCSANNYIYYSKEEGTGKPCAQKNYNLIWVLDESGSVQLGNYKLMQEFVLAMNAALKHHNEKVLDGVAGIKFSTHYNVRTDVSTPSEFEDIMESWTFGQGGTNIQDGLFRAKELIGTSDVKTIVVLLTDGVPTYYGQAPSRFGPGNQATPEVVQATQEAARNLLASPNVELIYGQIANAQRDLFDPIPDVATVDLGNWRFDQFFSTLVSLIGESVCKTSTPSRAPTTSPSLPPSSIVPTLSPTLRPSTTPTSEPTTLSPSTCTVRTSGQQSFNYPETATGSKFWSRNSVPVSDSGLALSDASTIPNSANFIYFGEPENVGPGFLSSFEFEYSDVDGRPPQGFAFVIQKRPLQLEEHPVSSGGGLGYARTENSVAVVFDLCSDRIDSPNDCFESTIYLSFSNIVNKELTPDASAAKYFLSTPIKSIFESNGGKVNVTINYIEQPKLLEVFLNDELYLRQEDCALEGMLGGRQAYVGFSTGTGIGAGVPQTITQWRFDTVQISPAFTEDVSVAPVKVEANNQVQAYGYVFKTKDLCNEALQYGGYSASMSGTFTSTDGDSLPAVVTDKGDGSYVVGLPSTVIETLWSLDFSFCRTTDAGAQDCFSKSLNDVVQTVPVVTSPPTIPTNASEFENLTPPKSIAAPLGIGLAAATCVLAAVALILVRFRNKWREDKAYVDEGKLVNLDQGIEYADNHAATAALGQNIMASKFDIMREKKGGKVVGGDIEIAQLKQEQAELQNGLRAAKMGQTSNSSFESSNPTFQNKTKKQEFSASPDDMI